MPCNTFERNQMSQAFAMDEPVWVFGYGSLIFKADFPWLNRAWAHIDGWERRFWQGSHDHRGTPECPGRVLTLIPVPGARCGGMAYQVTATELAHLDWREKNGYLRFSTALHFADGREDAGLVYIATPDNAAWLGEADEWEIARQIHACRGPSGPNDAYLLSLARSLREHGENDAHVFALEQALLELRARG